MSASYPEDPNPSGLCMCGCGQRTTVVPKARRQGGYRQGAHLRYVHGHFLKAQLAKKQSRGGPNPSGLCQCGCGGVTPFARCSNSKTGDVEGAHLRFIPNHHQRLTTPPYVVDPETGCWVWQRYKDPKGYGRMRYPMQNKTGSAHRFYYELHRGPIPVGMVTDHLCRNPSCVNPSHIELVSPAENSRRKTGVSVYRKRKTP